MNDDPHQIAEYLISEHGQDGAMKVAVEGTAKANEVEDLYRLSVWRDAKRILREHQK